MAKKKKEEGQREEESTINQDHAPVEVATQNANNPAKDGVDANEEAVEQQAQSPEKKGLWQKTKDALWNNRSFWGKVAVLTVVAIGVTAATFATLGAFGVGIGVAGAVSATGSWIAGAASSVWAGVTSFGVGGAVASGIVGGAVLGATALGVGVAGKKINDAFDKDRPRKKAAKGGERLEKYTRSQAQQQDLSAEQTAELETKLEATKELTTAAKKDQPLSTVLHESVEAENMSAKREAEQSRA